MPSMFCARYGTTRQCHSVDLLRQKNKPTITKIECVKNKPNTGRYVPIEVNDKFYNTLQKEHYTPTKDECDYIEEAIKFFCDKVSVKESSKILSCVALYFKERANKDLRLIWGLVLDNGNYTYYHDYSNNSGAFRRKIIR